VALFTIAVTSYLRLVLPLTTLVFLLVLLFLAFIKVREVYSCRSVVFVVSTVIDTASSVRLVVVALLSMLKVTVPLLVL
jgi:hypothetical protein